MIYHLILYHAPSVYDFRKQTILTGPISDVVPSSPVFEMYPIGFTSIAGYLEKFGYRVKIVNLAQRMLQNPSFDVEKKIRKLKARMVGIDLHWLPHIHGSIEIARLVKKYHPDTPVLFGGLSATYFHKTLLKDYDCIDFVLRGDSTEHSVLLLLEEVKNSRRYFSTIPNLTWRAMDGITANPLTSVPSDINQIDIPDYRYTIRSVFKYGNLWDPLPYHGWLKYPNTALLTARGCTQGCSICGGSQSSYLLNCNRARIAARSPEKLIEDILFIQKFSRAPIFIIHDIRQCGREYLDEFLGRLQKIPLKNELVFELFQYADADFFAKIHQVVPKYSIEITLETYDEEIRTRNGKFICSNQKVIETLQNALNDHCNKIDLFFMVGLPYQDYASALKNIAFCEEIHKDCGYDSRISYFVAPLAPFLDPASPAYENPEHYGYKKLFHSLEDYRNALVQPSWKYTLSYETKWMTRDDIVKATYASAFLLNEFKYKYQLIDRNTYEEIAFKIHKSLEILQQIDEILELPPEEHKEKLQRIKHRVHHLNQYSICGDQELKWEVKKHYANVFSLGRLGLELLLEEILMEYRRIFGLRTSESGKNMHKGL